MKVVDVVDPTSINRAPDKTVVLLSSGNFIESGYVVRNVHLNLYIQRKDPKLGIYSLITVQIETDKGTIEMTYDEGYRGDNALEGAAAFLTSHLGISGLILRAIIQLQNSIKNENLLTKEENHKNTNT